MRVLLINGSPNEKGCTYTALKEIAKTLEAENVETEIIHIGKNCIMGCAGCGACSGNGNRCIFDGGIVNTILDKMETSDGLIVGTPVFFASPNGAVLSLLDRIFMAGNQFYLKPAAAIASARRAGTTASIDVLNKYFNLSGMPIVSSNYYNVVHGHTPEETIQDEEGMQTMRTLGRNMAWLLKCIEAGKEKTVPLPEREKKIKTSYIR